jgi:hypothetical protein
VTLPNCPAAPVTLVEHAKRIGQYLAVSVPPAEYRVSPCSPQRKENDPRCCRRKRRAGVGGRDQCAADVRIVNDPGGEVSSYLRTFYQMRVTGERIVIDGPCLSACTLLTGIVPRDHVCVTRRAVLGFHAASYYNDVSRSLVPTRAGTRAALPPGNPRLDQPAWRAHAASHHDAWPGSGGALPVLPLTAGRPKSLLDIVVAVVARRPFSCVVANSTLDQLASLQPLPNAAHSF